MAPLAGSPYVVLNATAKVLWSIIAMVSGLLYSAWKPHYPSVISILLTGIVHPEVPADWVVGDPTTNLILRAIKKKKINIPDQDLLYSIKVYLER